MDYNTANKTASFIRDYVRKGKIVECDIHFHGGEPLLNYEIIDSIFSNLNSLNGCKFNYSLTTNATLLTKPIVNQLEKYYNTISISLDGKQVTHDFNRKSIDGKGTFEDVIKGISLFDDVSKIRIRMTVTKNNVKDLFDNISYLSDRGFYWIDPGIDLFEEWDDESSEILERELIKVRRLYNTKTYMHEFDVINPQFYLMNGCQGGYKVINIDYNGGLYPCSFVVGENELRIGNIWNGLNNKMLECIREKEKIPLSQCEGCNMSKYCISSNCRILQSYIMKNDDAVVPIICRMQGIKYKIWKKQHNLRKD
jgi:uncharacterized protein